MKHKIILYIPIFFLIFLVAFFTTFYVVKFFHKRNTNIPEVTETIEEKSCLLKTFENEDEISYIKVNMKVEKDKILNKSSEVFIKCLNKKYFQELENNEEFKQNRHFDEANLQITLSNNDYMDFTTRDEIVSYQDYINSLKEIGYICD